MVESNQPRLLLQYLEPSPALASAGPVRLREHLAHALELLPVTDLALGWELPPGVVEVIRPVIPAGVTVWRWVPVFTDPGAGATGAKVTVGLEGIAPPPFRDLPDFRFLCLDQDEVVEEGLERAVRLGREIEADGVLLDRIRWHSPSASPAAELTCFCDRSRAAAVRDGLDLEEVGDWVTASATTLDGRRRLVAALLGGAAPAPFAEFLAWRAGTVTAVVAQLSRGLAEAELRAALDVFTPALATSVGQDLSALGPHGEWSKSMTYFEAQGPASMPFELTGYARWLEAAGDPDVAGFLSETLGFPAPGAGGAGTQLEPLAFEAGGLAHAIGLERSVVGIDAVEIAGVCEVDEADLDARIHALRSADVGISPCWDLLLMGDQRIAAIARAWEREH